MRTLKETTSRCPVCVAPIPASVESRHSEGRDQVWLTKQCPDHGFFESLVSSDARFYWLSTGAREDPCCSGSTDGCALPVVGDQIGFLGRNARLKLLPEDPKPFHKLSTCLALIEIVDSCNLTCPTCFADSPVGTGAHLQAHPLNDLQTRIQGVIDRKGKIEILQLSGGEPTLHPEFFELIAWCHENPGIDYVLVNSNGVRLAKDHEFGEALGQCMQ